jgi:hypothetical protein
VGAMGLEPLRQPLVLVHRSQFSAALRHISNGQNPPALTAKFKELTFSVRR